MLSSALVDVEELRHEVQDPDFNADEYLESYIQRNMGVFPGSNTGQLMNLTDMKRPSSTPTTPLGDSPSKKVSQFDPVRLLQSLDDLFDALVQMNNHSALKYHQCEADVERKEMQATEQLQKRTERVEESLEKVDKLESELTDLARKVYYLCDNIKSVSEPRERLKDARKLLTYFMELNQDNLAEFTFPELSRERRTVEDFKQAEDTILRLYRIAKDMGTAEDKIYNKARDRIFDWYAQFQNELVMLFTTAHRQRPMDIYTMQQTANILQNFQAGYQQCIASFVQRSAEALNNASITDIFRNVVQICEDTSKIVHEIFPAPDTIMEKFISYIIEDKVRTVVKAKLDTKNLAEGQEGYLRDLYELHKKTKALEQSMARFRLFRMEKIMKTLFDAYLNTYMQTEVAFLKNRCTGMVQQYYDHLLTDWHLPKPGPIQILPDKKDFFNVGITIMSAKTIPAIICDHLKERPTDYLDTQTINESLALNILHELRQSATRAHALAPEEQLGHCLLQLGQAIITHIVLIHMDYGLEIGTNMLPPLDPKSEPNLMFLKLVHLCTVMHNLTVQQLNDSLRNLPRYPTQYQKLRELTREAKERLERKSSAGLEHCLNAAMNWIHVLLSQQRKTEYAETKQTFSATSTARKVAQYFLKIVRLVEESVDGLNRECVFMEMGFRFHREILDRLQELPYTTDGVMILICDVSEYRECVRSMKVDAVTKMFDQLLSLCNLLVAPPVNLPSLCDSVYSVLEQKEPIAAFLKLRSDARVIGDYVRSYL
ncbi:exocyst complex component 5-like [Paramacrobiotus metropolitanus]|uniref:exocyst complex component 5-like n=1 Tax=Paramacrobiotus metropolitanus TaxID=2943436 RepID=UPI002445FC65|nr:exocyst complex component 5-like [Paramacrobiotus metropolitanus]